MDRLVGFFLLVLSVSVFCYYTVWVLVTVYQFITMKNVELISYRTDCILFVQPFIDEDHPIQNYFPSREYAIGIPLVLMVFVISVTLLVLSCVMIKSSTKNTKNKLKTQ